MMRINFILCLFILISVLLVVEVLAAAPGMGCLTGGCHQQLAATKYLHGPVAAEMAGVKACEMCHVSTSVKCSSSKGGKFSFKSRELCSICHSKGTGSQHSDKKISSKCLKCHDPHGSETSRYMLRSGS